MRNSGSMWIQIVCGLLFLRILQWFFSDGDSPPVENSESSLIFYVANRIEKIYGGKAYAGLRIPDADTGTRQTIDIVHVNKDSAIVIAVRNFVGFVDVDTDGSWVCKVAKKRKAERHPNPVAETKRQAAILEAYLVQRGLTLPEGYLLSRVLLPNPRCRPIQSINFHPEVISSDKWTELKPDSKIGFSSWIKDTLHAGKKDTHDVIHQQLHVILSTTPMWDRLELKGDKSILGEFLEFKGREQDMQPLRNVRRSKVGQLIVQKSSLFSGLGRSNVIVLYSPRDYRNDGVAASEWKEVMVKSSTEILFQPINSKKPQKIKISAIVSLSLST